MPQFTVYCYVGTKHRRRPITTISSLPPDWGAIKRMVEESAIVLWNDKHESTAILSVEKHLGGAYKMAWHKKGYSQKRLYYKRSVEFACQFVFNSKTQKVMKMTNIQFGPALLFAGALEDFRRIERKQWKMPASPIPKSDSDAISSRDPTKRLLMQPSAQRYGDYTKNSRLIYGERAEELAKWKSYDHTVTRSYMPKTLQLLEEKESAPDEDT